MRKMLAATLLSLAVGAGSAYAADVVVRIAPPRAVVEHRDARPSRDHVWVPGFHRWDGHAYAWERGHWELPPRAHARWVAPRWEHRGKEWRFREGRWR
jgi:hypothetical protein